MNFSGRLRGGLVAILGLILFTLTLSSPAGAQEVTASLQGTVKDTSGGTLANAAVTLTGDKLIGEKKVITDGSGYYRFVNLPPGTYTINVRNAGFTDLKREGIELNVGRIPTIDITLSVGSEQTIVEVNTGEPQIDVTSSRTQTTVTSDEIQYAPRGQSYQSVLAFVPGARNEPLQGGFQIDGGATAENSYLVNGMETGSMVTGKSVANVPFEFIKEVQVKTGGIEAENGGALGGVVNVIAQSGTNNWHGSDLNTVADANVTPVSLAARRTAPGVVIGDEVLSRDGGAVFLARGRLSGIATGQTSRPSSPLRTQPDTTARREVQL